MRLVVAAALAVIIASQASAQPAAPLGPPPVFKVVNSFDKTKGQIIFLETLTRQVPVTVERIVIVDGVQQKVTETRYVTELMQQLAVHDATQGRAITPDGKQLPIDEMWKRLKVNTVVLVSGHGNTPNQVFLRALSAETLILIPGPPAPPPEPKKQ